MLNQMVVHAYRTAVIWSPVSRAIPSLKAVCMSGLSSHANLDWGCVVSLIVGIVAAVGVAAVVVLLLAVAVVAVGVAVAVVAALVLLAVAVVVAAIAVAIVVVFIFL
jgi:hypothetical protein